MYTNIQAIVNQKGGVGKSFSCINIGIGLARAGKKVLLVDFDPQASMTIALGYPQPDQIPMTVTDLMTKVIEDEPIQHGEGIIHHQEGIDLLPANIQLSGMEVTLVNMMLRFLLKIGRSVLMKMVRSVVGIMIENATQIRFLILIIQSWKNELGVSLNGWE